MLRIRANMILYKSFSEITGEHPRLMPAGCNKSPHLGVGVHASSCILPHNKEHFHIYISWQQLLCPQPTAASTTCAPFVQDQSSFSYLQLHGNLSILLTTKRNAHLSSTLYPTLRRATNGDYAHKQDQKKEPQTFNHLHHTFCVLPYCV